MIALVDWTFALSAVGLVALVMIVAWLVVHRVVRAACSVAPDFVVMFQIAFAAFPWCWLASFAALVVRARVRTGEWPRGLHVEPEGASFFTGTLVWPAVDPKEFQLHHLGLISGAIGLVLSLAPFAPTAWVAFRARTAHHLALSSAYLAGLLVCVALWTFDPGGFVDWFLD